MRRAAFLAVLGTVILVGCGPVLIEDLEDNGGTGNNNNPVSFASDVYPTLQSTCGLSGCHGGTSPQGGLATDGACTDVFGNVSGLVNPSDVGNSDLLIYATGGNGHTGGAPIAVNSPDYDTWWTWIEEGASNDC